MSKPLCLPVCVPLGSTASFMPPSYRLLSISLPRPRLSMPTCCMLLVYICRLFSAFLLPSRLFMLYAGGAHMPPTLRPSATYACLCYTILLTQCTHAAFKFLSPLCRLAQAIYSIMLLVYTCRVLPPSFCLSAASNAIYTMVLAFRLSAASTVHLCSAFLPPSQYTSIFPLLAASTLFILSYWSTLYMLPPSAV